MATQSAKQSPEMPGTIDAADVRQTLERVLHSRHFVNAHKKKQFLRLICDFYLEGRAQELNEYILGYEVFERDSSYNPSADPIVRVVAHEIRKKLESYYQAEGVNDEVRLELPSGSYQPVFIRRAPPPNPEVSPVNHNPVAEAAPSAPSTPLSPPTAEPAGPARPISAIILGLVVLGLVMAVIALALSNWELRQKNVAEPSPLPAMSEEVWGGFLRDKSPPVVVLSNPLVPRFTSANEPAIDNPSAIPVAPEVVEMLRKKASTNRDVFVRTPTGAVLTNSEATQSPGRGGPPAPFRLVLSNSEYTGIGEAIGLHHLTNFFHENNREIVIKQSRTLSAEDLKNRNVILLGGAWVNEWSGKLPDSEDFVYTSDATIVNRNLQPGEAREYAPQFDRKTGQLSADYALITVKPNLTEENTVMVLSGINSQGTQAAVEYLTNKNQLEQFGQSLRQLKNSSKPPRHFQALLKVGVENGIPTTITPLAIHPLNRPRP